MCQTYKKIISIFAITVFVLSIFNFSVSATNSSIEIRTSAIDDANEFDATLTILNNPGFAAFNFDVEFDPAFMIPIAVEKGHALYEGTLMHSIKDDSVAVSFLNIRNVAGNGDLLKIRFKVSANALGTSTIKLTYKGTDVILVINQDYEDLTFDHTDGTITVESEESEDTAEQESTPDIPNTPPPVTPMSRPSTSSPDGVNNEYVVSYETNSGYIIPDTLVSEGLILSIPPVPIKAGFSFAGWYLDEELTQEYDFNIVVKKSFTLYAKWLEDDLLSWINPFSDVNANDWFYSDVEHVVTNGLFNGTTSVTFAPNAPMTRSMLVTVLWRLAGAPDSNASPFADVPSGEWFSASIAWAESNKIVNGIGDNLFAPDTEITREQMAAILYRYEQFSGKIPPDIHINREFSDWNNISDYAKNSVNVLVIQGVINGKLGNLFDPQGTATRAEVAALLHRFIDMAK